MKKKWLTLLLSLTLVFASTATLSACKSDGDDSIQSTSSQMTENSSIEDTSSIEDSSNEEVTTPTESLAFQKIAGKEEYRVVGLGTVSDLDIVIPSSYKGLPVTEICSCAFYAEISPAAMYITSVKIPGSVTRIGDRAFWSCLNLTSVNIPDSVTSIGDYAFKNCNSLQYNELDGLKYLGNETHKYLYIFDTTNTEITTANISTQCKWISSSAFYSCTRLTDVYYSGTQAEWEKIIIGSYNEELTNATIHFLGEEN